MSKKRNGVVVVKLFFFFFKTQHTHTQRKERKEDQSTEDGRRRRRTDMFRRALSRLLSSPPPGAPRSRREGALLHACTASSSSIGRTTTATSSCASFLEPSSLTRTTRTISPSLAREHQTLHTPKMVSNNINSSQKRSYVGVIVEDGNVDRAMRRLKRTMINEKMFDAFKERLGTGRDAGFKKPSEKRVLALKERDRRVFKKKLKQKIGWILRRRERGF